MDRTLVSVGVAAMQRLLADRIFLNEKFKSRRSSLPACDTLVSTRKHIGFIVKTSLLNDIKDKLDKSRLKVGQKLIHRFHGIVRYTSDCALMERFSGSASSVFVEHEGEIIEVGLPQVSWLEKGGSMHSGRSAGRKNFTSKGEATVASTGVQQSASSILGALQATYPRRSLSKV